MRAVIKDKDGFERTIEDIEIQGIDTKDYPDFCDAFINNAVWIDNGKPLTEEELDHINENDSGTIHELVYEQLF